MYSGFFCKFFIGKLGRGACFPITGFTILQLSKCFELKQSSQRHTSGSVLLSRQLRLSSAAPRPLLLPGLEADSAPINCSHDIPSCSALSSVKALCKWGFLKPKPEKFAHNLCLLLPRLPVKEYLCSLQESYRLPLKAFGKTVKSALLM